MSWSSFYGGVFLAIALCVSCWGLWAHDLAGMAGPIVGIMAWGCLATACEKKDK
jgi:hypothetical protein